MYFAIFLWQKITLNKKKRKKEKSNVCLAERPFQDLSYEKNRIHWMTFVTLIKRQYKEIINCLPIKFFISFSKNKNKNKKKDKNKQTNKNQPNKMHALNMF